MMAARMILLAALAAATSPAFAQHDPLAEFSPVVAERARANLARLLPAPALDNLPADARAKAERALALGSGFPAAADMREAARLAGIATPSSDTLARRAAKMENDALEDNRRSFRSIAGRARAMTAPPLNSCDLREAIHPLLYARAAAQGPAGPNEEARRQTIAQQTCLQKALRDRQDRFAEMPKLPALLDQAIARAEQNNEDCDRYRVDPALCAKARDNLAVDRLAALAAINDAPQAMAKVEQAVRALTASAAQDVGDAMNRAKTEYLQRKKYYDETLKREADEREVRSRIL